VFLDIGAHSGTYAITLAPYCKEIHSFEPQRMTYYSLCGGVALSGLENVFCHQFGLGSPEQVGVQTLNIVSEDGGGSSLHTSQHKVLRTEQIEVRTLDSLNLDDIGFIKMDVEENELFVLKGAFETLMKNPYIKILFEYNGSEEKGSNNLFYYIETKLRYNIIPVSGYKNMYLATR
jgi:FkbM family methyltransferase